MCGCKGKCGCNITSTTKGEKGDASPVASLGYKVYKALISQSGTSVPTAIVLTNTLGATPTFSRNGTGQYFITCTGKFTVDKTLIYVGPLDFNATHKGFSNTDPLNTDVNNIEIETIRYDTGLGADDLLNKTTVIIEVYP